MSATTGVFDIAGAHTANFNIKAHAAATATEDVGGWRAPAACTVAGVYLTFSAAVTGADTNTTHINIINRSTDGLGTTEVGNKDFVNGTNAVASAPLTITTTAFDLAAGAVVAVQAEKVGTGLALPTGEINLIVKYR
jgi:hypothetical protein